jgi:hypothetical protein
MQVNDEAIHLLHNSFAEKLGVISCEDFKAYPRISWNQTVQKYFLFDYYNNPELKKGTKSSETGFGIA